MAVFVQCFGWSRYQNKNSFHNLQIALDDLDV